MKKLITLTSTLLCAVAITAGDVKLNSDLSDFTVATPRANLTESQTGFLKKALGNHYDIPTTAIVNRSGANDAATPSGIETKVLLFEDFTKWTAGEVGAPDDKMVQDETEVEMDSEGEWTLFRTYQAGGTAYTGFDEIGDDGPGYIKTPAIDVSEGDGVFRVTARVRNANENVQNQSLQAFLMDETNDKFHAASAKAMKYDDWSECVWISRGSNLTEMSAMLLGWNGKVYFDWIKVEQLIYPLSCPEIVSVENVSPADIKITWKKVEGATGYKISVSDSGLDNALTLAELTVDDTESAIVTPAGSAYGSFVISVTAVNGEKESYPEMKAVELLPKSIGKAVALDATDISETGFTANWTDAEFAPYHRVLTRYTRTAESDGEEYVILDDTFAEIPVENNEMNPLMFCPLAEKGGLDFYLSRHGWTVDLAMMANFGGTMPAFVLSNQLATYGLPGQLISPAADFSKGNGTVRLSGEGASAADDVVMGLAFIDADNKIYAEENFELTTGGDKFEVTLSGGQPDSRLVIYMADTAGEDMVMFMNLKITTTLNAGESFTMTHDSYTVPFGENSLKIETALGENDVFEYAVQGFYDNSIYGEASDYVTVKRESTGIAAVSIASEATVSVNGNVLSVVNPAGDTIAVFSADGRNVYSAVAESATIALSKGIYVVTAGGKSQKVAVL